MQTAQRTGRRDGPRPLPPIAPAVALGTAAKRNQVGSVSQVPLRLDRRQAQTSM